jgi:hypothetical protein
MELCMLRELFFFLFRGGGGGFLVLSTLSPGSGIFPYIFVLENKLIRYRGQTWK